MKFTKDCNMYWWTYSKNFGIFCTAKNSHKFK